MTRIEMIKIVGENFLKSNIENGEFSYAKALGESIKGHYKLDVRFYDEDSKVAVLIETKQNFSQKDKKQLFSYVALERKISNNTHIIAILANTTDNKIKVWKIVDDVEEEIEDIKLKSFQEYIDYFKPKNINDKTSVLDSTSKLNRILHDNGIVESLRSQFVGTCLLALKNGLIYKNINTAQILAGIKGKLGELLCYSMDKATKLAILNEKVLQNQVVEEIESDNFRKLLDYINLNIIPYINDATQEGHDILSYFFTTFNKYVAREDKNQAFTPNHISHFMCKIGGITRVTKILDPTCGSGTFLVQAMTQALQDCRTNTEREIVMKQNIYGIEKDENVFGLATTNMLIHGDGNSNIIKASCFDKKTWIEEANIDLVLMNPPYNASKSQVPKEYGETWGNASTDPSKGLYFVNFIAKHMKKGRLLTLLPMSCAISNKNKIGKIKSELLENHTLDAVFSFPDEMFYPGASAVACCMVFDLGKPHPKDHETFFGYFKNDSFEKRKGIGRTDAKNEWSTIENEWISLYRHRKSEPGKSVTKKITAEDEWCAEAYMETDYSTLADEDFIKKMRDYVAFLVSISNPYESFEYNNKPLSSNRLSLNTESWKWFEIGKLFKVNKGHFVIKDVYTNGNIPLISATQSNNGIAELIVEDCGEVFKAESITVASNGKPGISFYQPLNFCATGDVNILAPKFKSSKYILLFITSIIEKEIYRFSYGRKWGKTKMEKHKIKLPATKEGNPDWEFMENYIKALPYSSCL